MYVSDLQCSLADSRRDSNEDEPVTRTANLELSIRASRQRTRVRSLDEILHDKQDKIGKTSIIVQSVEGMTLRTITSIVA